MRGHGLPLSLTIALTTLGACASARSASDTTGVRPLRLRPVPNAASSTTPLTAATLDSLPSGSLLDALRQLRPDLLRPTSPTPDAPDGRLPAVYINDAPHGDVSVLATIPSALVASVRYLRPGEATARYGRSLPAGVLAITTRR